MPLTDQEILERFGRRFAAIERQVPATARFGAARHRRGTAGLWAVPAAAAVIVFVTAAGTLLTGRPAGPGPSALVAPSLLVAPSAVAATPAPTGLSVLAVGVVVEPRPELPSGLITTGMVPFAHYAARLRAVDGSTVALWAPDPSDSAPTAVRVEAGSYRLSLWRYNLTDNVETGARSSSPPASLCSTTVALAPSVPTRLVATFSYGGADPCAFSVAGGKAATASQGAISAAEAAALARKHVSPGAALLSVASGYFAELDSRSGTGPAYPVKPGDLVWAVRFSGTALICPPPAPSPSGQSSCLPARPASVVVFLDLGTGEFLASQGSAPAP
jgi:hypothetical protein